MATASSNADGRAALADRLGAATGERTPSEEEIIGASGERSRREPLVIQRRRHNQQPKVVAQPPCWNVEQQRKGPDRRRGWYREVDHQGSLSPTPVSSGSFCNAVIEIPSVTTSSRRMDGSQRRFRRACRYPTVSPGFSFSSSGGALCATSGAASLARAPAG